MEGRWGKRILILLGLALGTTHPAQALQYEWGAADINLVNRASLGAQWRIEERDPALIGKLNLNPELCAGDDCHSFADDPAPNQRLVDAPGGFFADKQDDGNLNYDRGDLVAAVAKLTTDLTIQWHGFNLKARTIAFFDAVNKGFEDYHPNNNVSMPNGRAGGYQAAYTDREDAIEDISGASVDVLDLVLSGSAFIGNRYVTASLGQQTIRWGEANLLALNAISEINPIDARRLRMPGMQTNEVFRPVPLAVVSAELLPDHGITGEVFYQLAWKPVQADPGGTYFADTDLLYREGPYNHGLINLGYFPEDPLVDDGEGRQRGQHRLQHPLGPLLTDTSFTVQADQTGKARHDGQYGVHINWFAEGVNNGTEFGFFYMRYHSRFPYLSFRASDRTPLRDPVTGSAVDILLRCQLVGNDCLPIDTARVLLDYPEDIDMFGVSFNTNIGSWSVSGEYAFRPNVPVQVHVPDVFFAALQPGFPEEDVIIGAATLGDLVGLGDLAGTVGAPLERIIGSLTGAISNGALDLPLIIPGSRSALPDYVESVYRGNPDADANIAERGANYYIPGFERLKVGQLAVTGLRVLGRSHPISSVIGAEQIVAAIEVGLTHVVGMPPLEQVQFDVPSPDRTHYSPGADGTGQPLGEPDPRSYNPTRQTEAFVTDFSWGYRVLVFTQYNDRLFGLNLKPFVGWNHDVQGYAPGPMANFLEKRREWQLGAEVLSGQHWSGKLQLNGYGGDRHNARRDRGNVLVELHYTF